MPLAARKWAMGCTQELGFGRIAKKNDIGNKWLEYLPQIEFVGCEVAISIILKFPCKYTCLSEVTFEMRKRNIISKNAEM